MWGLVNIPNWYMDCVLTNAQYELFLCDSPLVVYDRPDREKRHTAKEMDELKKKWEEKRRRREEQGQRFSLNDFLRKGAEALPTNKDTE